ncbi:hypothetical protein B0H10DRAFT_1203825 [Mycena sp. CBHHK59/15]|nr:hypothetical protein B0H10DRAFT_1203825 [Mycena sp. CBHHK59/15]
MRISARTLKILVAFLIFLFLSHITMSGKTRAAGASGLDNPQLFTESRNGQFMCNICPNSKFITLSKAQSHTRRYPPNAVAQFDGRDG